MNWLPKWCDDAGFIITVAGFTLTIIPLFSIKRSVQKVANHINNNNYIADLSRWESVIDEIKRHLVDKGNPDIELDKKVAQIKNGLLLCKTICENQDKDKNKDKVATIEQFIVKISNHQNLINKAMLNPANKISHEELLNTLDEIRTIFAESINACKAKV